MKYDISNFAAVWERVSKGESTKESSAPEAAKDGTKEALGAALAELYELRQIYSALIIGADTKTLKSAAEESISALQTLYFIEYNDCLHPQTRHKPEPCRLSALRRAYLHETELEAALTGLYAADNTDEYRAAAERAKENRALLKALLSKILT